MVETHGPLSTMKSHIGKYRFCPVSCYLMDVPYHNKSVWINDMAFRLTSIDDNNSWKGKVKIMWSVDQSKLGNDNTLYYSFTKIGVYPQAAPEEVGSLSRRACSYYIVECMRFGAIIKLLWRKAVLLLPNWWCWSRLLCGLSVALHVKLKLFICNRLSHIDMNNTWHGTVKMMWSVDQCKSLANSLYYSSQR